MVKTMHYSYTEEIEKNNFNVRFEKYTSPGMKNRAITL